MSGAVEAEGWPRLISTRRWNQGAVQPRPRVGRCWPTGIPRRRAPRQCRSSASAGGKVAPAFVGREAELALLDDIYLRAKREERPAAALVTGLHVSGKTHLLGEFRRRQGASRQLNVGGYQTGAQVPLAAAGDLLRTLVKVPGAGRKLEEALFGATTSDDRPLEPLRIFEASSVRIGHDLIRSSVAAQLPPLQRRELHGLFAGWLERQAGDDVQLLLEALVHRQEAGLEVGNLALRVLQSPRRRLLGVDGLRNLSRIADRRGFSEPLDVALHERIAVLASELAEHHTAMERWMELAANVSDPSLRARCFLEASRAASRIVQRRDEALSLLARARSLAPSDPVLAVEIEADHANLIRSVAHRMEDGRKVAEQAAGAARRAPAPRHPTQISSQERNAYVAALQAAFDSAVIEEDASDLLRISEAMTDVARGSEEATVAAALNMSRAMWFFGRAAEALDHARRAWLQAHDRVLRGFVLEAGAAFASRLIDTGAFAEADEVISECIELERRIGGGAERLAIGRVAVRSIPYVRHQGWLSRGGWRGALARPPRAGVGPPPPPHPGPQRRARGLFSWRCGGGV